MSGSLPASRFLASVRDESEARIALESGADIIDLKEPAHGALGAVPIATARAVVAQIAGAKPVSATIGDVPLASEQMLPAVSAMAQTGVDFIKIGMFAARTDAYSDAEIAALRQAVRVAREQANHVQLVAVFFADRSVTLALIDLLARLGFSGVMLDTADKSGGRLLDHMTATQLGGFVSHARRCQLFTGLAGSLRASDVPVLLPLSADYLGFRGALCVGNARGQALHADRVRDIAALFGHDDSAAPFPRLAAASTA